MGETETQLPRNRLSRIGTRRGEIVEVNGGHIVRSTGLKDRHSKVCTAKGTRDRRVRLSAHTAIQFYDVQDRLGYDRPSKAVDWLINKARAAIDELAELPPWNPIQEERETEHVQELGHEVEASCDDSFNDNSQNHGYSEAVKSFFPAPACSGSAQDLRLSLQSFESSPVFSLPPPCGQTLVGFDHSGWSDHNFQRMVGWNPGGGTDSATGAGPPLFGGQFGSQRGPLQSNDTQSIRAWIDPPQFPVAFDHRSFPVYHHGAAAFQGFSGFRIPARIQGEEEEHDGISDKPSAVPFNSISRR